MKRILAAVVLSAAALSLPAAGQDAAGNLHPGVTASELMEREPIHWVSIEQIEASLEGQAPMVVGFDVDDTVLFSSPCFYYGQMKYSPGSNDYLGNDAFWADINNGCDQYSIPKQVARRLIAMHQERGDEIYFITGRTKGGDTETVTDTIQKAFGIEDMNPVVFTASSENKLSFMRERHLAIYYGDADSDMTAAIEAGARPIRVIRAQNSTYKPEPRNGRFGEEVIVNSAN